MADIISTLRECADDLENEIKHTYDGLLDYPHNQVKFERDMEVVTHARAAIATVSELIAATEGLMASFENYASINRFQEEWDEYDHMMFPRWAAARAALAKAKGGA